MPDKFPLVKRPYRTQQDMIIRDRSDSEDDSAAFVQRSRPHEKTVSYKMQERPYRTNEDMRIQFGGTNEGSRSKSADAR